MFAYNKNDGTQEVVTFRSTLEKYSPSEIYTIIKNRREHIQKLKNEWGSLLNAQPPSEFLSVVHHLVNSNMGNLERMEGGMGGTYCLFDEKGKRIRIIKPTGEGINELNNPKRGASPYDGSNRSHRVRVGIPLYVTVQTEVLAYKVAEQLGIAQITPKTEMAIIQAPVFHDVIDETEEVKLNPDPILQEIGPVDKEKLCSVQEFISDAEDIADFLQGISQRELSEKQERREVKRIDPRDVENCLLFCWVTGEADGNGGNFLVYKKEIDEEGNQRYGLKKIDNGLSFSETNKDFNNLFVNTEDEESSFPLPQLDRKLSVETRERILKIKPEEMAELMKTYGKSPAAIEAFWVRIEHLQRMAKDETTTIREINDSIAKLGNARKKRLIQEESDDDLTVSNHEDDRTIIEEESDDDLTVSNHEDDRTITEEESDDEIFMQEEGNEDYVDPFADTNLEIEQREALQ